MMFLSTSRRVYFKIVELTLFEKEKVPNDILMTGAGFFSDSAIYQSI